MSIRDTSALDLINYGQHFGKLLEFIDEIYIMTNSKQTDQLNTVLGRLQKQVEASKSVNKSSALWYRVQDVHKKFTGTEPINTENDVISALTWAYRMRKTIERSLEEFDENVNVDCIGPVG